MKRLRLSPLADDLREMANPLRMFLQQASHLTAFLRPGLTRCEAFQTCSNIRWRGFGAATLHIHIETAEEVSEKEEIVVSHGSS